MMRKQTALLATVIVAGSVAAMTALAQAPDGSPPAPQGQGKMQGHGGMMGMGHMDPEHMKQMTRMMENCNRMMERASEKRPDSQNAPEPDKRK